MGVKIKKIILLSIIYFLLNISFSYAQPQIDWLISQQNLATGLVDSYEGDGQNYAYTYDQALAIIAFTTEGETNRAKNILNRFNVLQNLDGSWYYCHYANNANICGYSKRAGDIAWMVMAINYYETYTGDDSYSNMAKKALNFLNTLRDTNPASETYGAVKMEPGPTGYSTENNYDAYSAYYYRGVLENDYSLIEKANLIKNYLIKEMWAPSPESNGPYHNVGVFWVGYNDFGFHTDPQSWGVLALGANGPNNEDFTRALEWLYTYGYGYGSTRHNQTYNPEIDGFDFWTKPTKNSIWLEGTEGVAAAYYSIGDNTKGDYFHNEVKKLVSPNGGIIYSFSEENPSNIRFPDNFRHNSIASTAWYYFNEKRINPFTLDISWYDNFVKVKGTQFYLNGKPFYFAGTNAYYLWYGDIDCFSPSVNQGCVIPLLDDAISLNLKVIRTWGFCNGVDKYGYCFQPTPGVYNETTFEHFDRVIKEASDRDLRLIITFVNNWGHFGGMCTYLNWCGVGGSCSGTGGTHDQFYTNNYTKNLYKNYVAYFINRTNTITGIKYKDDPTIFAWELANEPRCRSDTTGTTLNNWIGEMSTYIKSLDPNHLVSTGIDGGYRAKSCQNPNCWWYSGREGQDYFANHNWSTIDFATFHYYQSMDPNLNATEWIQEHIEDAHNIIGKPVLFEEFNNQTNKATVLQNWYNLMETYGVNGDTFWMLSDNYFAGNNDGYFVLCPEDSEVCNLISDHALYMYHKTNPSINFSIYLQSGWNLASIPLVPLNKTLSNVLESISGEYSKIFSYFDGKWIELENNDEINETIGFYIKMSNPAILPIEGYVADTSIGFQNGWNLIGHPYLQEKAITELYENNSVYSYNGSWSSYIPNRTFNSLQTLKPGYGYWVRVE